MNLRTIKLREALAYVEENHRHNKPPRGWRFGVAVEHEGKLRGVGIAGRPVARMLDPETTIEITRCCTTGQKNACSMIYGALCRAAAALGYRKAVTYTRADEDGASLRASGFKPVAEVPGREWDCQSRQRVLTGMAIDKIRWERDLK